SNYFYRIWLFDNLVRQWTFCKNVFHAHPWIQRAIWILENYLNIAPELQSLLFQIANHMFKKTIFSTILEYIIIFLIQIILGFEITFLKSFHISIPHI